MQEMGGIDEIMEPKVEVLGKKTEDGSIQGLVPVQEENTSIRQRRPFHCWEVNGRDYKLKLTTAMIGKLENKYRTNILNLVSNDGIPPLSVMLTITQAAMVPWLHKMSYAKVQDLYDQWLSQGGSQMEFFTGVLMPTMEVSGFFTEAQAEALMKGIEDMDRML